MHVELQESRLQQQKLQLQQKTITSLKKDVELFRKQTEKMIENLQEQKQQAEYPTFRPSDCKKKPNIGQLIPKK